MSRARTSRLNTAGQAANTTDYRRWRPIWLAGEWPQSSQMAPPYRQQSQQLRHYRSSSWQASTRLLLTCRQPEPAGRQSHWCERLGRGDRGEAARVTARVIPTATIIALLVNPTTPAAETVTKDAQAAARGLGVQLHVLHASSEGDFDSVFATVAQLRAGALVIGADPFFTSRSQQLAKLAVDGACDLRFSRVRCGRRPDNLRNQHCRRIPSGCRLHRPYPQR